jgi:hypothetical protein
MGDWRIVSRRSDHMVTASVWYDMGLPLFIMPVRLPRPQAGRLNGDDRAIEIKA